MVAAVFVACRFVDVCRFACIECCLECLVVSLVLGLRFACWLFGFGCG